MVFSISSEEGRVPAASAWDLRATATRWLARACLPLLPLAGRRRITLPPDTFRTYRVIVGIFNPFAFSPFSPPGARWTTIPISSRGGKPIPAGARAEAGGRHFRRYGRGRGRWRRASRVPTGRNPDGRSRRSGSCLQARANSSSDGIPRDYRRQSRKRNERGDNELLTWRQCRR